MRKDRIFLSPPHMGAGELDFVREAFATNSIVPDGPNVRAFEREFEAAVKSPHAVAMSSGTAALHLAVRLLGVKAGDDVFCSDLTVPASANPIVYQSARPVFIDSDLVGWNMDPNRLEEALKDRAARDLLPKAVVLAHAYGQSADLAAVDGLCAQYEVPLIEDASQSLGASYQGSPGYRPPGSSLSQDFTGSTPGTRGIVGVYSFDDENIITCSGGGMFVTRDDALAEKARFLADQAQDPAPHCQHSEIGFNYQLSNVLAGIGRGQLRGLPERVNARRRIFARYAKLLGDLSGLEFMPEAPYSRSTRWLTCILLDPERFGNDREAVRKALEAENVESRPLAKPMHLDPLFVANPRYGGEVAASLFERGLCLPSGSSLTEAEQDRVVEVVRACCRAGARQ